MAAHQGRHYLFFLHKRICNPFRSGGFAIRLLPTRISCISALQMLILYTAGLQIRPNINGKPTERNPLSDLGLASSRKPFNNYKFFTKIL